MTPIYLGTDTTGASDVVPVPRQARGRAGLHAEGVPRKSGPSMGPRRFSQ
jgi:hypothetical protein